MRPIRWGILSTGRITAEFIPAVQFVPDACLYGIASRDLAKAEAARAKYGAVKAYGSYEDMARNPDIDIVYVATPTALHAQHVRLCLEHGKHVLCEKAATVNTREFDELCRLAEQQNLFLMEAVWMRFHPAFRQAVAWVKQGAIGDLRLVKADLGWLHAYDEGDRMFNRALGGGTLLDLGPYTLGLATAVFGPEPDDMAGWASLTPDGVDRDSTVLLRYGKAYAALNMGYSFDSSAGETILAGTRGRIVFTERFHDAQRAFRYDAAEQLAETLDEPYACNGYEAEIQEAQACLRAGKLQSDVVPWAYTRAILRLIDRLKARFGVTYPGDGV